MRNIDGQRLMRVAVVTYVAVPEGTSKAEARRRALTEMHDNWEDVGQMAVVVAATERRVFTDGAQSWQIANGPEVVGHFTDAAAAADKRPVPGWEDVEPMLRERFGVRPLTLQPTRADMIAAAKLAAVRVACARAGASVTLGPQDRIVACVGDVEVVDRLRVALRRSIGQGRFTVIVERTSTAERVRRLDVIAGASDPGAVLVASYSSLAEAEEREAAQ